MHARQGLYQPSYVLSSQKDKEFSRRKLRISELAAQSLTRVCKLELCTARLSFIVYGKHRAVVIRKEGLNTFWPEVKVAWLERTQTKIFNAACAEVRKGYE